MGGDGGREDGLPESGLAARRDACMLHPKVYYIPSPTPLERKEGVVDAHPTEVSSTSILLLFFSDEFCSSKYHKPQLYPMIRDCVYSLNSRAPKQRIDLNGPFIKSSSFAFAMTGRRVDLCESTAGHLAQNICECVSRLFIKVELHFAPHCVAPQDGFRRRKPRRRRPSRVPRQDTASCRQLLNSRQL